MSETRPPTLTCAMPRISDSRVTSSSRLDLGATRADRQRRGAVPVVSVELDAHVEREDVARRECPRRDGMPCTTSSFTEAHTVAGYPR